MLGSPAPQTVVEPWSFHIPLTLCSAYNQPVWARQVVLTAAVGGWTAFFLLPEPTPTSWLLIPLTMAGVLLSGIRPARGALIVLVASALATVVGAEYGGVELLLATFVVLYALGRGRTPLALDLVLVIGFVASTALRPGAGGLGVATAALVYGMPWLFGVVVRVRVDAAARATRANERLAAIDVERLAHDAAAQESRQVLASAIETLREALSDIRERADEALAAPSDAGIQSVQACAHAAISRLHRTLHALNVQATRRAPADDAEPVPRSRRWGLATVALGTVVMITAGLIQDVAWYQPVVLVPALLLPFAAWLAIRDPLISAIFAVVAFVAGLLDPHEAAVLVPVMVPLAIMCWRFGQHTSRQSPYAWGLTALGAMPLAFVHGREAVGFVLLLSLVATLGGHAWEANGRIAQREETRAARITAQLAAAQLGAEYEARRTVSRDLHDVLSHAIASISLQSEAGRVQLADHPERAAIALTTVREVAATAVSELDGLTGRLTTERTGYTVDDLVESGRRLGLHVEPVIEPASRQDPLVYRIVQESLTNAARYAPGTAVSIQVDTRDGRRHVTVQDRTVDTPQPEQVLPEPMTAGLGSGLPGLAERVRERNGTFHAGPVEDGFLVSATWPIDDGEATDAPGYLDPPGSVGPAEPVGAEPVGADPAGAADPINSSTTMDRSVR